MNPQLFEVIGSFVEAIPDNLQQWKRMRNFVLKIGKQDNRTRKENRTWKRPSDLIGLRGGGRKFPPAQSGRKGSCLRPLHLFRKGRPVSLAVWHDDARNESGLFPMCRCPTLVVLMVNTGRVDGSHAYNLSPV